MSHNCAPRWWGAPHPNPDMNSINAVFFDLFHTLVDVAGAPGASGRYTADILGVDRQAWNAACFGDLHEISRPTEHVEVVRVLAHSIDPSIPMVRIEQAAVERQRRFDHALMCIEPQVVAVLDGLRTRGFKLGLISNASSGEVRAWGQSPLAPLFDRAIFSCECGLRKPDPAIFRHALAELGVCARESLFVGDGGSDEHRGAGRAGLYPVLLTRYLRGPGSGKKRAERLRWAKREIGALDELPGMIEGLRVGDR